MQLLATNWLLGSVMLTAKRVKLRQQISCSETVCSRLDWIGPRANKRRPKIFALLTKLWYVAKLGLITAA